MQWFESKKAILEYCGKDGKDVRRLDRAIKDGRIGICEGAYYLVSEYVEHLEKENGDLEEQVVALRKQLGASGDGALRVVSHAMGEKVLDHGEINRLKEEIEKLKEEKSVLIGERNHLEQELEKRRDGGVEGDQSDLDFQIAENERLEAKVANYQEAIKRCYMRARNVKKDKTPWPEFKKEVLKLEEELPGEDNQ